jgi:putative FmdB family regulatory protein
MPLYEFACVDGHETDRFFPMGECPPETICSTCDGIARRLFGNFHFQEDRCRFSRSPIDGSKRSQMLGQEYPQDRRERDAIYAAKGIEPVTASTMPENWRRMKEYADHVKTGGEHIDTKVFLPPAAPVKSIRDRLRESNVKINP